jgi:hypothetical protein
MIGSVFPAVALLLGIGPVESGQADAGHSPAQPKQSASVGSPNNAVATKPDPATASGQPRLLEKVDSKPLAAESPAPTRKAVTAAPSRTATTESNLPADVAAEIKAVESMHHSILVNQPIEEWKFDNVRARYQTLLKQSGADPAVEEALRSRLATITRQEQASRAARTISTILSQSRRRDQVVAAIQNRVAASQSSAPSYSAVGFVQRSSSMLDGHKVYALIGQSGSTVAYLDVPPGLDVNAHFAHRVGVRGVVHYNEDLGARLITVRDIEALGKTRR